MPTIPGENLVTNGPRTGAAYVLGRTTPDALSILMQGQRQRDYAARQQAIAKQKADELAAKDLNDKLKYEVDGSHIFGDTLQNQVYNPLNDKLVGAFKANPTDAFARTAATRPLLEGAQSETQQSKRKTAFIDENIRKFQSDSKLYNPKYATESLVKSLRDEATGLNRLPSQFDEEAWLGALQGDAGLYNEPEVIRRATSGLLPTVSQKISEAGTIGGQHSSDLVRGKLIAMQNGKPILNADGSPKLNLGADLQGLLEADPLFKLKVDAREAAYNAKREADPTLPQVSRRGHIAQMVGPLAFYDTAHDEGLNRLPPQPKSAGKEKGFVPDDGSLVEGDYSATLPATAPAYAGLRDDKGTPVGYDFSQAAGPQKTFQHLGQGKQPILKTASGDLKEKHTDAIKINSYYTEDGKGNFSEVTNNVTPQAGVFGPSTVVAVDVKTNKPLFSKSREEQKQLIASGAARPQLFIDLAADKNEKFAADKSRVLRELTQANNDPGNFNKKSPAELEDQATKIVSKGVTRHFIPYNAQNAQAIDPVTGGHYRAALKTMLRSFKQGAAPAPKAKANPLGFGAPAASKPSTAPAAKPKANPLGF
jgi:hypothetical protein